MVVNYKNEIELLNILKLNIKYDVVILAVGHNNLIIMTIKDWVTLLKPNGLYFDLKGIIPRRLLPVRI